MRRFYPGMRGMGAPPATSAPNIDTLQESAGEGGQYLSKRRDFYVYEAASGSLTASATATDTIQIEADSNFILQKLAYLTQPVAGTAIAANAIGLVASQRIIPQVGIILVDTGSGRQLMQNPIPIPSIFGTGELPFILPNPRLFQRNSTIQVQFTNFDATNTWTNIRLAFIGYKVYSTA